MKAKLKFNLQFFATIDYAAKYATQVDERFKELAKTEDLVNHDYDFVGTKTVNVYSISTSAMTDYTRSGSNRYGTPTELDASAQEMTMRKDRSFTFTIDKMNEDETAGALNAAKALARQIKEVVVPEIDTYRLSEIATNAGVKKEIALTAENIYDEITTATEVLDDKEVPIEGRVLVVNPTTYKLMKQSKAIVLDTEVGADMRLKGVVAMLDGMPVKKVPSSRLGEKVNFIITHQSATVGPVKLAEYKIHTDVPGISGSLVEGRVYYDAFILKNKAGSIYACKAPADPS